MPLSTASTASRPVTTMSRRSLLTLGGLGATAWLVGPVALQGASATAAPTTTTYAPFVDAYRTNVSENITYDSNAVVRVLGGMTDVWQTGPTWDSGVPLRHDLARANMRACVQITGSRTPQEEDDAFVFDRQHQSYSVIAGLGAYADAYKTTARAVTSITAAPATTPPTKIADAVPPDAPAGSAIGAGAEDSTLGSVVTLVNTLRGWYASSNPSKYAYQYPRPWRMNLDNDVVDTGAVDSLGYPVYDSPVEVVETLLRQRSETPAEDGGFPSGHTNAVWLASFAFGHAFPERLQPLLARASDIAHSRIQAGMHSTFDVVGGRTMATALAAATLYDAENAAVAAQAHEDAGAWLAQQDGGSDPLTVLDRGLSRAARRREAARVRERMTYVLPRSGRPRALEVPKGAEALLAARFPYLSAAQRRAVLRTTALEAPYALIDGPEQWGRLDVYRASAGYGSIDDTVTVRMDASLGRLSAADRWWNDITGTGRLVKEGTGLLALAGENDFRGGVTLRGGVLRTESERALGQGAVVVDGGTLEVAAATEVEKLSVRRGTVRVGTDRCGLDVDGRLELDRHGTLRVQVDSGWSGRATRVVSAGRVSGRFGSVVASDGRRLSVDYRRDAVYVSAR